MMRAMHIGTMTLALHPRPLCTSRCTTVVGPTIVTAYARIPVMTSRMTDLFLGITRRFPRGNAELQDEDYVASTISTIPDHGIRLNHDNTPLMNLQRRQRKIAQRYRSFRRRQGSITKGQRRALRDFWPTHGLEMDFARRSSVREESIESCRVVPFLEWKRHRTRSIMYSSGCTCSRVARKQLENIEVVMESTIVPQL